MTTCPQWLPFNSPGTSCAVRTEVAGSEVRGPLDLAADLAGRGHPTSYPPPTRDHGPGQREANTRAKLDRDIQALPRDDPLRDSCVTPSALHGCLPQAGLPRGEDGPSRLGSSVRYSAPTFDYRRRA